MLKFFPKLKDLSSKINGSASTEPEPTSSTGVETKVPPQTSEHQEVQQSSRLATLWLSEIKRLSIKCIPTVLIKPFTGPRPLHRRYFLLASCGIGGGIIALGAGWLYLESILPNSAYDALTYVRPGTLTIKASDGTILKQMGPVTREKLKIWEFPKPLLNAFVAIEDRRFYQHEGVDYQGLLRAVVSNLQARGVVEGGSTITQQVARIVFLDQERSIWRKIKEFRMAQKIERDLTKEQILERYLNLVYLGEGAYGVGDAAWVYFSKSVDELTLPEMATLAGLPPAPNEYSPFVNKRMALQRRNIVLQRMQEGGYITASEAKTAKLTPLNLQRSSLKRHERKASYFTQYIEKELPKFVSPKVLQAGGLTIETTLNPQWQKSAEEAVQKTIEENGERSDFKQAALVAIDPRNGQIKAMVGGKDFYNNQFNRVTQANRQPGSTFKAFVYTTAIAAGFTPYRGYLDAPFQVDGYTPKNYSETYRGWTSMREALINSINVVALKVLIDVGWEPTIQIAHKMGIESDLQSIYSLALGGAEVNLLELTSAYGTFATQGVHSKPHGIRRIFDSKGSILFDEKIESQRALDEETSAIMTWMLQGVVNEGTGRPAQLTDRPVAGKTGTTDEARDLWFVGYIPQLVAGVWLGNDDNNPTRGSSSTAADTWRRFMVNVVTDIRPEQFPPRPEKLENRQPKIQVQPIQPKSILSGNVVPQTSSADNSSGYTRRRRRYSQQSADNSSGYTRPRYRRYR